MLRLPQRWSPRFEAKTMRFVITLSLLILAAIAIQKTSPQSKPSHCESNLSRHTSGPLGDEWLTWSHSSQIEYVRGYYEGYQRGDRRGCLDTAEFFVTRGVQINMAMPSDPADNCRDVMLRWTQSHESLVASISKYYEAFPTDCVVPVPLVIDSLSDQKQMTFIKIHHWYVEGELSR
jgi:hypothetical protein